jgi:hypothetical protein
LGNLEQGIWAKKSAYSGWPYTAAATAAANSLAAAAATVKDQRNMNTSNKVRPGDYHNNDSHVIRHTLPTLVTCRPSSLQFDDFTFAWQALS